MKRFRRQCPWCHGEGGWMDVIVDGQGPVETCEMCNGKGEITNKRLFFQILGWMSGLARMERVSMSKSRAAAR